MIKKKKEVVQTEEEKEWIKKKARLARARLLSKLEREQDKKNEENYLENEEFYEEILKGDAKEVVSDDDGLEKDEEEKDVNNRQRNP